MQTMHPRAAYLCISYLDFRCGYMPLFNSRHFQVDTYTIVTMVKEEVHCQTSLTDMVQKQLGNGRLWLAHETLNNFHTTQ